MYNSQVDYVLQYTLGAVLSPEFCDKRLLLKRCTINQKSLHTYYLHILEYTNRCTPGGSKRYSNTSFYSFRFRIITQNLPKIRAIFGVIKNTFLLISRIRKIFPPPDLNGGRKKGQSRQKVITLFQKQWSSS